MSEAKPVQNYREMMLEATRSSKVEAQTPENYFSTLSVRTGAIAGFIGAIVIIIALTAIAFPASMDLWLAPRFIASIFLGESAFIGVFPIILGTVIHILLGTVYGAVFAVAIPRLPRAFWFVAGLIYSIGLWGVAAYILPTIAQTNMMTDLAYTNALIISHILFGITLGIAGSFFGDIQSE